MYNALRISMTNHAGAANGRCPDVSCESLQVMSDLNWALSGSMTLLDACSTDSGLACRAKAETRALKLARRMLVDRHAELPTVARVVEAAMHH